MSSLILIHEDNAIRVLVTRSASTVSIWTPRMRAILDKKTGALTFLHASVEEPGASTRCRSTVQRQPTFTVEDRFMCTEGEHLFGSGEFQDSYLDIRELPRRLTQVNTQIAIPLLIPSKGYVLLWHNYGLTDLNPADNRVALTPESIGAISTESVTTTAGARTETGTEGTFSGDVMVPRSGSYAMMPDVGQKTVRRYRVDIDGKSVVNFAIREAAQADTTGDWRSGAHSARICLQKWI